MRVDVGKAWHDRRSIPISEALCKVLSESREREKTHVASLTELILVSAGFRAVLTGDWRHAIQ